jgi:hypothetical protein
MAAAGGCVACCSVDVRAHVVRRAVHHRECLEPVHLDAYGPADAEEFARWFDLNPPLAKRAFARLADALHYVDLDGRSLAMPREHLEGLLATPPPRTAGKKRPGDAVRRQAL